MFLLDTNVVSELRRPHRRQGSGVGRQHHVVGFISLEHHHSGAGDGALLLRRRDERQGALIQRWIEDRVLTAFSERILAVDTAVARQCALLHAPASRPYRDSLIAATALVHNLTVVTRNRADFEPMAITVLNPWE